MKSYPRVLIVAMGRINATDTNNNGLLLRRLFAAWPKESLAQIYSSGDNGDQGYFGHYYQLGASDRRFGSLFYRLKGNDSSSAGNNSPPESSRRFCLSLKAMFLRLLVDTGLYELFFRPRISRTMSTWVEAFQPDFIFAQGYSLSFVWLPVLLKSRFGSRLAFLTTDDWPTYLYAGNLGEPKIFRGIVRQAVRVATRRLIANTDVPFAFGQPMADEYAKRYGKKFIVLSHVDDPGRFAVAQKRRVHPEGVFTILTAGYFNRFRWPYLLDVNECCRMLGQKGIDVRVAILASGIDQQGEIQLRQAEYIDILDDPGDAILPSYLQAADLLMIIEGFDSGWVSSISLSVSTKAHLFMMAKKPIVIYGHHNTGVVKYAKSFGWAFTVTRRDIIALEELICSIAMSTIDVEDKIQSANNTVNNFHLSCVNNNEFIKSMR